LHQVETHAKALAEDVLIEKIKDVHCIGIRSKTKLTKKVLDAAEKLGVVGCFCIGTNQVDLEVAAQKGIAVFNSPFSNSRSVAELVLAEIVLLSRQLGDRNNEMHQGIWSKVSANCFEIRGKTLGKKRSLLWILFFLFSVLSGSVLSSPSSRRRIYWDDMLSWCDLFAYSTNATAEWWRFFFHLEIREEAEESLSGLIGRTWK